jgi:hypothetical protein
MPVMDTHLLFLAHRALGLSQGDLGKLLGASTRTGQRWGTAKAFPSQEQVQQLARHVDPVDAQLAAQLAQAGGTTLMALGLGPPPPPPPAPPFVPAPDRIVDSVVCAAAEAMGVMPGAIRPALLAAFTRGREIGLGVDALEKALRDRENAANAKKTAVATAAKATSTRQG